MSDEYTFQEYPKCLYHDSHTPEKPVTKDVQSVEEEVEAGDEWQPVAPQLRPTDAPKKKK